ncbi:putative MATE efflux family protein 7-like [Capsicum annuum]|uniref:Uncharacterized protein n=1 Tax=Capsicum annuum TaxID=4072 RepID=A0A2G3AF99_CAPAN|nr:putative MATE efflux family protein 7-like [Capsicum annuum]KAF3664532.1 putative MATE efflux family protein 7-like [Capsicum annuum]PHT92858.1 hypothetical protein T459_00740 [Capsicum annuum]
MISFAGDLGNDLLPEEMKIAYLTADVVSATLVVIKEVIRSITSLLNQESSADTATFAAIEKISSSTDDILVELEKLEGCSEDFGKVYSGLRSSLKQLKAELDQSDAIDTVAKIENLVIL